ncbi:MAG TPA: 30S ribosomal protein S20 [Candidatus Krumholzibacteriaceae bacterium]
MPTHKSAEKRMRQNERKRLTNKAHRTSMRKWIKAYRDLPAGEASKAQHPHIESTIDKAAKKGIIHHRKASRLKSRLSRKTVSA